MPHFLIETNDDESVRRILRDGEIYAEQLALEQHFSIVTTYFRSAGASLSQMNLETDNSRLRLMGLQSFVMSLTGLEAFANTYFHVRADEQGNPNLISRISRSHGALSRKIEDLIDLSGDGALRDQEVLIDRIFQLSRFRNDLLHPRWQPSSLALMFETPIYIEGLVENPQRALENIDFCRECLFWCLLVIARIFESRGIANIEGHMFYWTSFSNLSLEAICGELGLS